MISQNLKRVNPSSVFYDCNRLLAAHLTVDLTTLVWEYHSCKLTLWFLITLASFTLLNIQIAFELVTLKATHSAIRLCHSFEILPCKVQK